MSTFWIGQKVTVDGQRSATVRKVRCARNGKGWVVDGWTDDGWGFRRCTWLGGIFP